MREGIHIVILGAPNAGKSSLLNYLVNKDAAIVSHRAGTTRDIIEVHRDIAGFPVILTDTAGLRDSADEIEEEGVRRALKRAEQADIRLILFDGQLLPALDAASLSLVDADSIVIVSKCDLLTDPIIADFPFNNNILPLSAQSGQGIGELINILKSIIISRFSDAEAPVITRNRHRALLNEALACLNRFKTDAPLELACEELRRAGQAIGKITGKIQVDDVLDALFRQFCIGK